MHRLPLLRRLPPLVLLVAASTLGGLATSAAPLRADTAAPTPQVPAAPPAAAAQAVANVQAFYDRSTTFKAEFRQKFTAKAYNQDKSSHGKVTFAKPGKMDWRYEDPVGNRVVSDGSIIKVYEANNKQMYEQHVDQSQYPVALSFLTGSGKLGDAFDFQLFPGAGMSFPGGQVLVGTPKQPSPDAAKVLFYVDTATSQVRRVMIIDGQGNRNRFDFENPRVNESVNDAQFQFTPPAGTSIIHP
jgi:outer membrane lipoprotein carrier protein